MEGENWAILTAGSKGYKNYRHQADVCHAYQVLKEGGLKDENIVVFMYDDIANNVKNPTPGIIINQPNGKNVYTGVPKDYTRNNFNARNFFAALLGNAAALTGGSGKVIKSGPNDNIFIFFSGHGTSRLLGMPDGKAICANKFVNVLKEKHATNSFKSMVIYIESCKSGSMFEGLLPDNLNIYAVTASSATEISYAAYCHFKSPYHPCLGDAFSVAWMEDRNDRQTRTLGQQYKAVRQMTTRSTVTQYGDLNLQNFFLSDYIGHKFNKARLGSKERYESHQLQKEILHRNYVDQSVNQMTKYLFKDKRCYNFTESYSSIRKTLVDDWDCLKKFVRRMKSTVGLYINMD